MKDEKFRELLREYAEEISDPENRKVGTAHDEKAQGAGVPSNGRTPMPSPPLHDRASMTTPATRRLARRPPG